MKELMDILVESNIDQESLHEEIALRKKAYVGTMCNLLAIPVLLESCKESMEEAEDDQTREAYEKVIETHSKTIETGLSHLKHLNTIIPKLQEFIK